MLTIGPATVAVGDGTTLQACVRIDGGRIVGLDDGPQHLDYELPFGSTVTPGLIDLQINGADTHWFNREPAEAVRAASSAALKHGVTSFLPTLMSGPWEQTLRAAREIYKTVDLPTSGARSLGVHFEGPFLNAEYRRFHSKEFIQQPTPALIGALLDSWTAGRCRVTMAPEIGEAPRAAAELLRRGVKLAAGHTAATYAIGNAAIEHGYNILTHSFNAMPPLYHRASSILTAYLLDASAFCEVIADGVHVAPEHLALLYRLKSVNLILTTDAMPLSEGLVEQGGVARDRDGKIAGSVLTLDQGVRNLMAATGITLAQAVSCATWAPARAMGLDDEIGSVRHGLRADLAVWDRRNRISHVFVGGSLAYSND
jgi:N-acetylglucosamine-6-phosphate deacetylase